jgi:SAM-dependent methyltransferase
MTLPMSGYERMFEELGEDFDLVFAQQMQRTGVQVEFAQRALRLAPGAHVLDIACGVGRHAVALARRGYRVTGLDISPTLLRIAAGRAERAAIQVEWVEADMRAIPFADTFDAALNLFSSWGYFESDAEDQRVLRSVAAALKPGGRFLLEVSHQPWIARHFQPQGWHEAGGVAVLEQRALDLMAGRLASEITVIYPDGRRRTWQYDLRLYTAPEVARMLGEAGMTVVSAYGGYDGAPLSLDSSRLLVLAERR